MRVPLRRATLVLLASAGLLSSLCGSAPAAGPTVAVLDFNTAGLTSNWYGNFQPGIALSDLLTDQLVNGGKFNVVDRSHINSVFAEHNLSTSGEVSPASAVQSGRLIGARYLITGNVIQFDKTASSGAAAGSYIPGPVGAAVGGVKTERVTLKVQVRVIDAQTGQIVQSYAPEDSQSGTSWGAAAWGGPAAGGYGNSNFVNSTMGHLINDEAIKIATVLDPSKMTNAAAPAAATLIGRVIAIDGTNIILNIGSTKGVAVGQYFDVVKVAHIKDPDSGKILTSSETVGKLQIVSVTADTSVAKRISGTVQTLNNVQSE